MFWLILYIQFIAPLLCLEQENPDYNTNGMIVANIKRRDIIPLQQHARRYLNGNNLSYRKTKDIREEGIDRHFEITQGLLKEAQRDEPFKNSPINEIMEDSPQLRGSQIRDGMQARDNSFRNNDMRENKMSELPNMNYNPNPNYYEKNQQEMRNEEGWRNNDKMMGGQFRTTIRDTFRDTFRNTIRDTIEDKMRYMEQVGYNNNYMRNTGMREKNLDFINNQRYSRYNDRDRQESLNDMNWPAFEDHNRL